MPCWRRILALRHWARRQRYIRCWGTSIGWDGWVGPGPVAVTENACVPSWLHGHRKHAMHGPFSSRTKEALSALDEGVRTRALQLPVGWPRPLQNALDAFNHVSTGNPVVRSCCPECRSGSLISNRSLHESNCNHRRHTDSRSAEPSPCASKYLRDDQRCCACPRQRARTVLLCPRARPCEAGCLVLFEAVRGHHGHRELPP